MIWELRYGSIDVAVQVKGGLLVVLRDVVENRSWLYLRFSAPLDRKHGRRALLR